MQTSLIRAALAALAIAVTPCVQAAETVRLDRIEVDVTDITSLQAGARTFVNYCLNCHSASLMRYNALGQIGLTEDQIKDNLLFTAEKIGMPMSIAMAPKDAKDWFGAVPPDLSVIARSRGPDWLYSYLRSFYRDATTNTGWNNRVYPNVGMPHVLWHLQGLRGATIETISAERDPQSGKLIGYTKTTAVIGSDGQKTETSQKLAPDREYHEDATITLTKPEGGRLSTSEYDRTVYDLVNFLTWMGEPHQMARKQVGVWVLFALTVLILITYLLKQTYWKSVH
jgi:ubiquinol-cytochrome c reductase cytochrome c1 subunit